MMDKMTRYLTAPARFSWQLWALAVVFCGLALYLGAQAYDQHEQASAAMARGDRLRAAQASRPVPKVSRLEAEEQKRWAALKVERDFAWRPLFDALEQATSTDIELLQFQPDKAGERVYLSGEARDEAALAAFLEALSAQATLKNVHLTHQENKARDRLITVLFEIKATFAAQD